MSQLHQFHIIYNSVKTQVLAENNTYNVFIDQDNPIKIVLDGWKWRDEELGFTDEARLIGELISRHEYGVNM